MKVLGNRFLVVLFLFFTFNVSAILVPKVSSKQIVSGPTHRLSLKEKTALWILRRKVKKQLRKHKRWTRNSVDTTNCDQILLKTGDRLDVRIIKISENSVRFVRCEGETDELVLSKDDIHKIVLSDGVVVYKNLNKSSRKHKSNHDSDAGRIVLIILAIIGGIILLSLLIVAAAFAAL